MERYGALIFYALALGTFALALITGDHQRTQTGILLYIAGRVTQ